MATLKWEVSSQLLASTERIEPVKNTVQWAQFHEASGLTEDEKIGLSRAYAHLEDARATIALVLLGDYKETP